MSNKLESLKSRLEAYKIAKAAKLINREENKSKMETLQNQKVVSDLIETGQCLYIDIVREIYKRKKEIKKADAELSKLNKNICKTQMLIEKTK